MWGGILKVIKKIIKIFINLIIKLILTILIIGGLIFFVPIIIEFVRGA